MGKFISNWALNKVFIAIIIFMGWRLIPWSLINTLNHLSEPQAIVILGGDMERITRAMEWSANYPELPVWISAKESQYRAIARTLKKLDHLPSQLNYDLCPTDTVSNFTCMVNPLLQQQINYVYLLTSDYHLNRSRLIAFWVFGHQGIAVEPVALASTRYRQESWLRIARDGVRAVFWVLTGLSGGNCQD